MNWQESSIQIRGLTLACRTLKNSSSKSSNHKIIVLHGWLDNCASFETLGPLIDDCEILAVDLPGHGLSHHRPLCSSYVFQEYLFDLYEILAYCQNQLGWQDVILMGHSMGSVVNTLLASGYASLRDKQKMCNVRLLINLDFFGAMIEPPNRAGQRLADALNSFQRLQSMTNQSYVSLEDAVEARLRKTDMRAQDAKTIMVRNLVCENNRYYWRFDKRLLQTSAMYLGESQLNEVMQSIEIEFLVVVGHRSPYIDIIRERVNQYQKIHKKIMMHELDGGHYVHMEQVVACANVINASLAQLNVA